MLNNSFKNLSLSKDSLVEIQAVMAKKFTQLDFSSNQEFNTACRSMSATNNTANTTTLSTMEFREKMNSNRTPNLSPDQPNAPDLPEEAEVTTPTGSPQLGPSNEFMPTIGSNKSKGNRGKSIVKDLNGYTVIRPLGSGAFGQVYLGQHNISKELVALKFIPNNKENAVLIKKEVDIMSKLNHPNIVALKGYFLFDEYHVIVQELVPDGELFDLVANNHGELDETTIVQLFAQCVQAVLYLHQQGIAHRDIKLENFLVDKSKLYNGTFTVKLCDFGFAVSTQMLTTKDVTPCGSDEYLMPELIISSEKAHDLRLGDSWALGVLLFALQFGELPFSSQGNRSHLLRRIALGDLKFPKAGKEGTPLGSQKIKNIIRSLLKVNPSHRTPLSELGLSTI